MTMNRKKMEYLHVKSKSCALWMHVASIRNLCKMYNVSVRCGRT